MPVRRKQVSNQHEWTAALANIRAGRYDWRRLDQLIDRTATAIRATVGSRSVAYAWSGGKDSLALGFVMDTVAIPDCVMGICNLEYPAFLQWVTAHMPDGLQVINTGQDLDWLARHPEMLFPANATIAAKWFKLVQHTAQTQFFRRQRLDVLILGRRKADGNYLGEAGTNIYTNREGITRYSPMADWSHEDVLALLERKQLEWPPIYSWPRGFQVGTHAWPARQWCGSILNGWREVYSIDRMLVEEAAEKIDSAQRFLRCVASSPS